MEKDEKKKGAMLDEAFLQNLMQNEQVEQILEEGEAFQTLMAYYRCAIMEVETNLKCSIPNLVSAMTETRLRR